MENVKVSVIIPCYNCSATIEVCVASVFHQSYLPDEIFLIDDGSSDTTLKQLYAIQEHYAKEPIRVEVLTQSNQGPSVARNVGLLLAQGDWIAFLDSDDIWHKDKLKKQLEILTMYPDASLIGGEMGVLRSELAGDKINKITFKKLCFKNYFPTPSVLVKAADLRGLQFNVAQKHSEDYRFFFDLLRHGGFGICMEENLASSITQKRRYGEAGLSGNIYKMQQGELSNFRYLYRQKYLTVAEFLFFYLVSNLKFLRRFILSMGYKLINKQ